MPLQQKYLRRFLTKFLIENILPYRTEKCWTKLFVGFSNKILNMSFLSTNKNISLPLFSTNTKAEKFQSQRKEKAIANRRKIRRILVSSEFRFHRLKVFVD